MSPPIPVHPPRGKKKYSQSSLPRKRYKLNYSGNTQLSSDIAIQDASMDATQLHGLNLALSLSEVSSGLEQPRQMECVTESLLLPPSPFPSPSTTLQNGEFIGRFSRIVSGLPNTASSDRANVILRDGTVPAVFLSETQESKLSSRATPQTNSLAGWPESASLHPNVSTLVATPSQCASMLRWRDQAFLLGHNNNGIRHRLSAAAYDCMSPTQTRVHDQLGSSGVASLLHSTLYPYYQLHRGPCGQGMARAPLVVTHVPPSTRAAGEGTAQPPSISASVKPFVKRCLRSPTDDDCLSKFQVYLRMHIEAFAATTEDTESRVLGRSKPIRLNQIGLRCRHCAHIPPEARVKGSTYFPVSTVGFYQAAQNMSSSHMQSGECPEMPDTIKQVFAKLLCTKTPKSHSKGGRKYWSQHALHLGLANTEHGVFPVHCVPVEALLLETASK